MAAGASMEAVVGRLAAAIEVAADELTRMDCAIGDGDHGTNMVRGFTALREAASGLDGLDQPDVLRQAGTVLVLSVGGASGPLYGSLLLGMARAAGAGRPLPDCLAVGIAEVQRRGRARAGAKTLLDVLLPVQQALHDGADLAGLRRVADEACEATRDMVATCGRASFLGERSRGHVDPGAASSRLLVHVLCDLIEEGLWPTSWQS